MLCGIFKIRSNVDPFWCQLASIFLAKIAHNSFKHRFPKPSIFRSIVASMFILFWLQLEPQVGTILAFKIGQEPSKTPPRTHLGAKTRPELQDDPKMLPKFPPRVPTTPPKTLQNPPQAPPQDLSQKLPEVLINWRGGTKAQPSTIFG